MGKRGGAAWGFLYHGCDLGGWIMNSNSGQPEVNISPVSFFLRSPVMHAHRHYLWSASYWSKHVRARDSEKGQEGTHKTKRESTHKREDTESAGDRHTQTKHTWDLKRGRERKRKRKQKRERGASRTSKRASARKGHIDTRRELGGWERITKRKKESEGQRGTETGIKREIETEGDETERQGERRGDLYVWEIKYEGAPPSCPDLKQDSLLFLLMIHNRAHGGEVHRWVLNVVAQLQYNNQGIHWAQVLSQLLLSPAVPDRSNCDHAWHLRVEQTTPLTLIRIQTALAWHLPWSSHDALRLPNGRLDVPWYKLVLALQSCGLSWLTQSELDTNLAALSKMLYTVPI